MELKLKLFEREGKKKLNFSGHSVHHEGHICQTEVNVHHKCK